MTAQIQDKVDAAIKSNPILVYSKSYCPYCRRAKALLASIPKKIAEPKIFELDLMGQEGVETQAYLAKLTGQGTVPNIFIGQKHIGGADDLTSLHAMGGLEPLLTEPKISTSRIYAHAFGAMAHPPNRLFVLLALFLFVGGAIWFGKRVVERKRQTIAKEKL